MHHAYLIIGSFESALPLLPPHVQTGAEDCQIISYEALTISDARDLRHQASLSGLGASGRTFIMKVKSITAEAQQALLKLFEDPADKTTFYVIAEEEEMFIPTFRSRCILWRTKTSAESSISETVSAFLASPYRERCALIQDMSAKKDGAGMEALLRGLEFAAHDTHTEELMCGTLSLAMYRFDRGISLKMILEHLALSFPIMEKVR